MASIHFDDFLQVELKKPSFREGYQAEKAILESALELSMACSKAGLTQR